MGATDISLGFYNQILVDYATSGTPVGNLGPSYNISTVNLAFTDNHGPSYEINTANLAFINNYGPSYVLEATGLLVGLSDFLNTKLIHYNVESEVHGEIVFGGNTRVVPPTGGSVISIYGWGLNVVDNDSDRTLSASESNVLNVNTSASSLVTLTLPPAGSSSGAMINFSRVSDNPYRVSVSGTDRIVLPTGNASVVELNSVGTKLNLISNGITSWLSI